MIGNIQRILLHDGGVIKRFIGWLLSIGLFITMTFYAGLFSYYYYFDQSPSVVQVFLKPQSAQGSLKAVADFIDSHDRVQSVRYVSAEEGLHFLQDILVSPIEDMIDADDFPSRFEVVFQSRLSSDVLQQFEGDIRAFKIVDVVSYDENIARSDGGYSMFLLLFFGMVFLSVYEFRRILPQLRTQVVNWLKPEYLHYIAMGLPPRRLVFSLLAVIAPVIFVVSWFNGFFFRFLAFFLEIDASAFNVQFGERVAVLAILVIGFAMIRAGATLLDKSVKSCYNDTLKQN